MFDLLGRVCFFCFFSVSVVSLDLGFFLLFFVFVVSVFVSVYVLGGVLLM